MNYVERMTMKIMGEMAYNYGNQPETAKIVRQIMADTKRAHRIAILDEVDAPYTEKQAYLAVIEQAEVKGE